MSMSEKKDNSPVELGRPVRSDGPSPIVVRLDPDELPTAWPNKKKWLVTMALSLETFAVSFCSAAYSGALGALLLKYGTTSEVAALGVSLYVVGFVVGPFLFAPLSEIYGRKPVFLVAFLAFSLCHLGGALGENMTTILVTRCLAGAFGSAPLTNAPAGLADIFEGRERGSPTLVFAICVFLGPVVSPIAGGYILVNTGSYHNIFWVMLAVSLFCYLIGAVCPETAAFAIARSKARRLTFVSGIPHISSFDLEKSSQSIRQTFAVAFFRPIQLLVLEPIAFFISLHVAISYATLYLTFAAVPAIFQGRRGLNAADGSLAFLGMLVGILFSLPVCAVLQKRYVRILDASPHGVAPPEARLIMSKIGAVSICVSLIAFAWTTFDDLPMVVPAIMTAPFGLGIILIFLGSTSYLLDTYTEHAASVMASSCILRSALACAFPEFSPKLFRSLNPQLSLTVVAAMSFLCLPMPFLFACYGPAIRHRSKIAREAAMLREQSTESLVHHGAASTPPDSPSKSSV